MVIVHCLVVLGPTVPSFSGATLYVRVLDVSRADAGAVIAGETIVPDLRYGPGSASAIAVDVTCGAVDARAHYSAWAHLDLDGDGQVSSGDWLTTESYPVINGQPSRAELRLQVV